MYCLSLQAGFMPKQLVICKRQLETTNISLLEIEYTLMTAVYTRDCAIALRNILKQYIVLYSQLYICITSICD
jgi:hypothetical protein